MFQVVVDMARSLDILHQIGAVSSQCLEYAFQHIERFGLVMNGVESCDEVEGLLLNGFVKIAQVGDLELVFCNPFCEARLRASSIASWDKSRPVKLLLG